MQILIVDEDSQDRKAIADLVKPAFEVLQITVAADQTTFEQELTGQEFDLVLTENTLSWTDGFGILSEVRDRLPQVPVILVTGAGSESLAIDALRGGFNHYVPKAAWQRLAPAVQSVLEDRAPRNTAREGLLTAMLDALATPTAYVDEKLILRHCNAVMADYLNGCAQQMVGQPLDRILPDHAQIGHAIRSVLDSGIPFEHLIETSPPDGDGNGKRLYQVRYDPHKEPDGRVVGCFVNTEDITERAHLLAAMKRQAAELGAAFEALPNGVIVCNPLGEVVQINARAEAILGCSAESQPALLTTRIWALRPQWEDGAFVIDPAELPHEMAGHGKTIRGVIFSSMPHGASPSRSFSMSAAPLHDPDGEVMGTITIFTDVTDLVQTQRRLEASHTMLEEQAAELEEQAAELEMQASELQSQNDELQRLEAQLRHERELLQTIYDNVPVMFSVYDPNLRQILLSQHFERVTGWTDADTARTNVMDLVYPDPEYRREIAAYMQSLAPGFKDIQMVTKSGEVIETSWANIQIPDGRQVGIGIDITERKRAEAELAAFALEQERLNTTNRLLLREVNHRVKNNLTAILSLIYTEKRRLNPEDGFRMESVLDDLAQRVESLAAAHTLLSRSQWQPLRLDMLAGRVIESRAPATYQVQRVKVDVHPSPVLVTAEQAHNIALVIGELVTNSAKYGCRQDHLEIRLQSEMVNGEVHLVYQDCGPGYPDEVLAGDTRSVGLSLLDTIVTGSLGGKWSIRNDHGAVTEVRFPHAAELRAEPTPTALFV